MHLGSEKYCNSEFLSPGQSNWGDHASYVILSIQGHWNLALGHKPIPISALYTNIAIFMP